MYWRLTKRGGRETHLDVLVKLRVEEQHDEESGAGEGSGGGWQ